MKKKEQGFTLIEIIVVLLIIGILLAITIPSIMGYVSKAKDAQLLTEARSVLLVTKTKGTQLYSNNDLNALPNKKDEIIKESNIDGTLVSIKINKQRNSSGDFILFINDRYVYYNDEEQSFEVKDKLENMSNVYDDLLMTLQNESTVKDAIDKYFKSGSQNNGLDSENKEYSSVIIERLNKLGYDTSNLSFRIYKPKDNKSEYAITFSENIADLNENTTIKVVRYSLGKDGFYSDTYKKQTGTGKVTNYQNGNSSYKYINLENTKDWTNAE